MSKALLSSKTIVEFNEPGIRQSQSLPTAISLMAGATERGPINEPTRVNSWSEYRSKFGSFIAESDMPNAVFGFFENGGTDLYALRIAHYTDPTIPATLTATKGFAAIKETTNTTDTLTVTALTEGGWSQKVTATVAPSTENPASTELFNFSVTDGLTTEFFANVTMDDAAANYVETVVNSGIAGQAASSLVTVTDLAIGGGAAAERPKDGSYTLSAGTDDFASINDADYIGDSAAHTGLQSEILDQIEQIDLVAAPGRTSSTMWNALLDFAENNRAELCFAVLDPVPGSTAASMTTAYDAAGLNSENCAVYWPEIKVRNPNKSVFGSDDLITVPPSGYVLGAYARNDARRGGGGLYESPAGEVGRLRGALGFSTEEVLDSAKRDIIYPKRINPINLFEGVISLDGGRTTKGNGSFPHVAQKRGAIFIANTVKAGIEYARHKPNNEQLRDRVEKTIKAFLVSQMKLGAFASQNPEEAFTVNTGADLNPPSVVAQGKLIVEIGLAFNFPAEFIVIRISQDTRALESELEG